MEGPWEGKEADSDCSPENALPLWKQEMSPPGTGILIAGLGSWSRCQHPPSITISLQGSLETLQGTVC